MSWALELCEVWARPCIEGLTLRLASGDRVGVVGPNGAGKTSLLRMAAGLERPARGKASVRPPVGLVPQAYARSLLPWLSVGDNVALPLFAEHLTREERRARVLEVLSFVPLSPSLLERRPAELSGGQQQLVALARALAALPSTLLLDEPFSALDAAIRPRVREGLRRWLARHPSALLLVSHDEADITHLTSRSLTASGPPLRLCEAALSPCAP